MAAAFAQDAENTNHGFAKGNVFITGTVGYNASEDNDYKTKNWAVGPAAGYFLSDKIALGISINYTEGETKNKHRFVSPSKNNNLSLSVFGRYYFTPLNRFSVFGEISGGYNKGKYNIGVYPGDTSTKGYNIQAGPGVNYFISPHFALQSYLGLISYVSSENGKAPYALESKSLNIGLNANTINLGLLYKI